MQFKVHIWYATMIQHNQRLKSLVENSEYILSKNSILKLEIGLEFAYFYQHVLSILMLAIMSTFK